MRAVSLLILSALAASCQVDAGKSSNAPVEISIDIADVAVPEARIESWRNCIEDSDCRTRPEALSGLAHQSLKSIEPSLCKLGPEGRPVKLAGQTKIAGAGLNVLGGESPLTLDEGTVFNAFEHRCDYNEADSVFADARERLAEAAALGDYSAAATLGALYLSDPDLFDPIKARSFLEPCDDYGGGRCSYQLARLESAVSEDGCGDCLIYLRRADARTRDPKIRFTYDMARRRLGKGGVNGPVFYDLSADAGTQNYIAEFDAHFPRIR